jgi:hypothetical protein
MDGNSFDELTRATQLGATRRGVLGTVVGGIAAAFGGAVARAAPADKVGICHRSGRGGYQFIRVSRNALRAHAAHGDIVDVDLRNDPNNCSACGNVCGGDGCNMPVCQDGVCATVPGTCEPPNACTTSFCDPDLGYVIELIDCGNSDACTAVSCDPAIGCVYEPVNCEDGNSCTSEWCAPPAGGCRYDPIPGAGCTTLDGAAGLCDEIAQCRPAPVP